MQVTSRPFQSMRVLHQALLKVNSYNNQYDNTVIFNVEMQNVGKDEVKSTEGPLAIQMSSIDWIRLQNWFETDFACTVRECREPGLYVGTCAVCQFQRYCFHHYRVSLANCFRCVSCNGILQCNPLTCIVASSTRNEEIKTEDQAAENNELFSQHS